jgi:hypothetical protein
MALRSRLYLALSGGSTTEEAVGPYAAAAVADAQQQLLDGPSAAAAPVGALYPVLLRPGPAASREPPSPAAAAAAAARHPSSTMLLAFDLLQQPDLAAESSNSIHGIRLPAAPQLAQGQVADAFAAAAHVQHVPLVVQRYITGSGLLRGRAVLRIDRSAALCDSLAEALAAAQSAAAAAAGAGASGPGHTAPGGTCAAAGAAAALLCPPRLLCIAQVRPPHVHEPCVHPCRCRCPCPRAAAPRVPLPSSLAPPVHALPQPHTCIPLGRTVVRQAVAAHAAAGAGWGGEAAECAGKQAAAAGPPLSVLLVSLSATQRMWHVHVCVYARARACMPGSASTALPVCMGYGAARWVLQTALAHSQGLPMAAYPSLSTTNAQTPPCPLGPVPAPMPASWLAQRQAVALREHLASHHVQPASDRR